MLNILRVTLFIILFVPSFLQAFQEQIEVVKINNEPIYSKEFLYAFNKNRNLDEPVNQDSLFKYLDQYINFKLKVNEAKTEGIDTTSYFLNEFNTYANEIKKPYLQNPNLEDDLINEAYQRLQFEINAAHILVRIPRSATPADTLRTYNKIAALRKRAVDGEDFAELARKNSEDGSASAGGELGYFTALSMVYPFETASYETEVGAISKVVKSQFGYHIIKVLEKRTARGRIKTAHIFVTGSNKPSQKAKAIIQQAYDSLQNGGDWRAICATFSEDSNTRLKGGSLPFYGLGQFPEPLLEAGFNLKTIGSYSNPVRSKFGWHIIKLEAIEPIKSLNEIRADIANGVKRTGRNQMNKNGLLKKLKLENGFKQDTSEINYVIGSVLQADTLIKVISGRVLFEIGSKKVLDNDFINFLMGTNQKSSYTAYDLWAFYQQFEFDQVIHYEDSLIPTKYPEHQYLINEYKEGLMLFEIMENKVWNKAIEDSIGLNKFFKKHQTSFPANERAEVFVIESDSIDLLPKIIELSKNVKDISSLKNRLKTNWEDERFALLKIVKRHFEQDDLPIFAGNHWKSGSLIADLNRSKLYWIEKILPEGYYELNEIKGLAISEYQEALDNAWIRELRKKNKIKINKKGIKTIIENLE